MERWNSGDQAGCCVECCIGLNEVNGRRVDLTVAVGLKRRMPERRD